MSMDELKEEFKRQLVESIDKYNEPDPKCAFAAGMLTILSAMKQKDGPSLPLQATIIHKALREIGEERGWFVDRIDG